MPFAPPAHPPFEPIEIGHDDGLRAAILPYGARLASLWVPTRSGPVNVVLGYADTRDYGTDLAYHGATIGRVAGRIARARFELGGRTVALAANEPPHHLHGGTPGFHDRAWRVLQQDRGPAPRLILGLELADGTDGYPGRLEATTTWTIEPEVLQVELQARVDRESPVAMTLHPCFNLSGSHERSVLDHGLELESDEILELDGQRIPTGRRIAVDGTPFDFRTGRRLEDALRLEHPQSRLARGLDHAFVLRASREQDARLWHGGTGLQMTVQSNQPTLQVYGGQYLAPPPGAAPWRAHGGICLEPQHQPNAVNEPRFPSPLLRPGECYRNTIRYGFATRA